MDRKFVRVDLDRADFNASSDRGSDDSFDLNGTREFWIVGHCGLPPIVWVFGMGKQRRPPRACRTQKKPGEGEETNVTVILSIWTNTNSVYLLSDVLLSAEGDFEETISLPHLVMDAKVTAGGSTLVDLAQKTVIQNKTAFVYAGLVSVAEKIMREFFSRSEHGKKYVALGEVIHSLALTDQQKSEVGILTFFYDQPGNVKTCGHNMFTLTVTQSGTPLGKIHSVGSGMKQFLLEASPNSEPYDYSLPIDIIHRLCLKTIEPFLGNTATFEHFYGAWFELSVHKDGSFRKIPAAFKFWHRNLDTETFNEHGPLVYSTYVAENLFITTVGQLGSDSSSFRCIPVPDPLCRTPIDSSAGPPDQIFSFAPELFVHVLLTGKPGATVDLRVCPFFVDGDPLITLSRDCAAQGDIMKVCLSGELTQLIHAMSGKS